MMNGLTPQDFFGARAAFVVSLCTTGAELLPGRLYSHSRSVDNVDSLFGGKCPWRHRDGRWRKLCLVDGLFDHGP
jgi:hypothetical protein